MEESGERVDGAPRAPRRARLGCVLPSRSPRALRRTTAAAISALAGAGGSLHFLAVAGAGAQAPPAETWVPDPFEPVRVERQVAPEAETGPTEIAVWGRRYLFARGPLPARIQSQGVDLLEHELVLELGVGGVRRLPVWGPVEIEESRPDRVRLRSRGRAGALSIDARTLVEYDGMIRIDLSFVATPATTLEHFSYELAFPSDVAEFFNHHVVYDFDSLRIDKAQLTRSAGHFPRTPRSLAFVPSLSVGNREVGIEWWSESNANWVGPRGFEPLELGPAEGGARFRATPIAEPLELSAQSAWSHTFALFPAPMRPAPPKWRTTRFTSPSQARRYDRNIGTRFAWIAFPGHFDARWHGLPESRSSRKQLELRAELRKNEIAYIPYGKLTAAPSLHPVVLEKASIWSATDRLFTGTAAAQRQFLEKRGWRPRQVYSYAACMARADYVDWMLEESIRAFREEQLDGLYYDWGAINEPCQRDPRVVDPARDEVFNYFNVRDFYKRLYRAMKNLDPEALLAIHTQGQPRALAAHVDYSFVGEALNVLFRGGRSFKQIRKRPELYVPDYFALPPGFLDAQLFPPVGGVVALLPQVNRGFDQEDPERWRRYTRAFYAIALVNDAAVWLTNTEAKTQIRIFQALDRFGGLDGVSALRWWENESLVRRDPRLRVTAYAKDGRALLIVSNWSEMPLNLQVGVDRKALGISGARFIRNAESRERGKLPRSGAFPVRVPARDFLLLLLE